MSRGGQDGFLGRWSARKLDARSPERHDEPDGPVAEPAQESNLADKSDAEILEELGLPDPEAMGREDDFSAFMKSAVPARLRNRALRRLWLTDPVLANLDELVDYGDDFTDAATVVENLATAYRVGRGIAGPAQDRAASAGPPEVSEASSETAAPENGGAEAHARAAEIDPASPVAGEPAASDGANVRSVSSSTRDSADEVGDVPRTDDEGAACVGRGDDAADAAYASDGGPAGSSAREGARPRRMTFVFTSE